ncbi:MAG: flagellar hook protein [Bdellovibrionaceae bacterium]|nr:flagellar hook protein [Pseudobdellovibrionaceae bacterium]|tara:strand:+ start:172114 stop:173400 length:1287 start_codon:yes stop_codon:yes gene_type:complete
MGVLSSLTTGVTGLRAQGEALSVIADNIANAGNTGFKASRVEFQDIVAKNLKGIQGGNQIGRGVKIGAVNPILVQGDIENTEKVTDLAISGDGYFVLSGSDGQTYTRDGSFHFDKDGHLVTNDNQQVMGFSYDESGRLINNLEPIKFPKTLIPAKPTEKIEVALNLDSRADIGIPFDPANPHDTSQFSTSVEMYDSQGNKHLVNLFFNKTADRTWEYHGMVDGKEVTGGEEGKFSEVVAGKVTFNVDGVLDTEEQTVSAFNFKGGALQGQQIKIDFGDSLTTDGGKGLSGTKQYGKESDVFSWNQDGSAAGTITSLSFDDEGTLTALYSNGAARDLHKVSIARFENPEGLFKAGNNRFKGSRNSGTAAIGVPNANGRGKIYAKSLERSTVDLANEFVGMIQQQRGFQANAKTITTTDELLSEVINLRR